jgi:hypothetical protein
MTVVLIFIPLDDGMGDVNVTVTGNELEIDVLVLLALVVKTIFGSATGPVGFDFLQDSDPSKIRNTKNWDIFFMKYLF